MGCSNTKSYKTRPDFYYQTSYLSKQYSELAKKHKQMRERIYEAIEKGYILQNQDISTFQDDQIIKDALSQLQLSKETHEFYALESEHTLYEKTQKSLQRELSEIVEQHKLLLKKIDSKQPPNIEKMLSKMQTHREKLLGYYRIIYSPQSYDEKTCSYQYQPSSKTYSTREDI